MVKSKIKEYYEKRGKIHGGVELDCCGNKNDDSEKALNGLTLTIKGFKWKISL